MRRGFAILPLLVVAFAGCQGGTATRGDAQVDSPTLAHVPHETTADGEKVVVVRDYFEPMKLAGGDEDRRVQYVWNYTRGMTQRRVWSADGATFEATDQPATTREQPTRICTSGSSGVFFKAASNSARASALRPESSNSRPRSTASPGKSLSVCPTL